MPLNQPARLAISTPGTLLTTTQTRFTVPNQSAQPSSAVVMQAGNARLQASVVSLHPVVVASQSARTIQTQGAKVYHLYLQMISISYH